MFFDRSGGTGTVSRKKTSETEIVQAPVRGYVRSEIPGFPRKATAALLDNWFPTTEGARVRKGRIRKATIDANPTHLAPYESGGSSKLFATDADSIYDITTPADPDVAVTADITGLSGGDWSSNQVTTTGGTFLIMVNGVDDMRQYDGSWTTINSGSSPAITGVDTADISYTWTFKRYVFMVEGGTTDAWYLPVDSIAGAASKVPLGGILKKGGSLLFGGTFSQDAGDGLDDYCVFISDKGEVALYQGTDPSSSTTWALVGVYQIGNPLHKNAHFRAGGDLVVATDEGIVPISAAVQKDKTALREYAITRPIEELWRAYMRTRRGLDDNFSCVLWPDETMLLVGIPYTTGQDVRALAVNAITGAWSSGFTGWDVTCCCVYDGKLYFGTRSATIDQGDVGGDDNGTAYQAVAISPFDLFKKPEFKVALHAQATIRTNYPFTFQLFANSDYETEAPAAGSSDDINDPNVWGSGLWGTMVWQAGTEERKEVTIESQNVQAAGYALAVGIAITLGNEVAADIELTGWQLQYEMGEVLV